MPATLAVVMSGVAGALVGVLLALRARMQASRRRQARAQELERIRSGAMRGRQTLLMQSEVAAREAALLLRGEADAELRARQAQLADEEAGLAGRTVLADEEARALAEARQELVDREQPLADLERERQACEAEVASLDAQYRRELERIAKSTVAETKQALTEAEIEEARTHAAQLIRNAGEGATASEIARAAKRLMGISAGRVSNHFCSDRSQSIIPLPEGRGGERSALTLEDLQMVQSASNVTLTFTEANDAIRIEGLDGVGRELARRCVFRLFRRPGLRGDSFTKMAREISRELDREILDFGQRGFALLHVPAAHPEIVNLVGRLNFRTSYAQNQWEHALESGYLAGLLAAELGLDVVVARRAALMHDIGKALTHEMDGSHALIGADYARRLGESETVANAIASHHTEEPFGSAYAHIVTAADAMSGGRPGARRQGEDNHMAKLAEIERIARSFRGVGEAFAVQGGREVRVYVEEDRVSDVAANKIASDIAQIISRELTFPGQIKVTVIREFKAVELAS
jgi:ribonuclease Y